MAKFFALDVETANASMSSICQIGIVEFQDDHLVSKWGTFVNPQDYFDPFNISIHGITSEMVKGAPLFSEVHPLIQNKIMDSVVVTHMPFDITALRRACEMYDLPEITCTWLDSARIVRRQWEQFRYAGYSLPNITNYLGIQYQAHDAVDDARASGNVVLAAMKESGLTIQEWLIKAYKDINITPQKKHARQGNPAGALFGETLVFTGKLSLSRNEAAQMAADAGCDVADSVTQDTTILVVGIQDKDKLAGYDKSSKHRKAETLIQSGHYLRIISERDFLNLLKQQNVSTDKSEVPSNASSTKIKRSITMPIRDYVDMEHRWRSVDQGLIWCWENGRQISQANPALAEKSRNGELVMLNWKGGIPEGFKSKDKEGTLEYLAQWQGLAGKDLDIDLENPATVVCSVTGVKVTFSKDRWKKAEIQE